MQLYSLGDRINKQAIAQRLTYFIDKDYGQGLARQCKKYFQSKIHESYHVHWLIFETGRVNLQAGFHWVTRSQTQ